MQHDAGHGGIASEGAVGFMNGLDALFLYLESPETPMHVGSMHVFEPPAGGAADFAAALRAHLAERLDRADVFTRRLAPMPLGLANPAWVRATEVELDHHVRRMRLPAPGTFAQLHDLVGSLHARPLDRDRPLWEMVVIEGLADGRIGFYAKVHHAGLDGQAGVALAQAVYDVVPRSAQAPSAAAGPTAVSKVSKVDDHHLHLIVHIQHRVRCFDVYIRYLRQKIDLPGCNPLIHTHRGVGYMLRLDE